MNLSAKNIAVIGAGWAGCAAAFKLAQSGLQVDLFEAADTLGGRARRVSIGEHHFDNGQHILLGAYQHTLQLLSELGLNVDELFLRLPIAWKYPLKKKLQLDTEPFQKLPAFLRLPLALLSARGLSWQDKYSLICFLKKIKKQDYSCTHQTVHELLLANQQSEYLQKNLWQALCIAALNTPPFEACAQVFINVLRDSLFGKKNAADFLIPRFNLSALFPEQVAQYLMQHQGQILTSNRVHKILYKAATQTYTINDENKEYQGIIIATAPWQLAKLTQYLPSTPVLSNTLKMVDGFKYQSIITVYLQYPATVQLSASMLLLNEAVEPKHFGQWVFDRGQGLLAVVISAANTLQSYEAPVLAQQIAEQLAHNLAMAELNQPLHFQVIHEKRATFSCSPGLVRASMLLGLPNAYLAGDYVSTEPLAPLYPATLETAVISGINAAQSIS